MIRSRRALIAVLIVVFMAGAVISAIHKSVLQGTDELAHVSYVAQAQNPQASLDLNALKMLDPGNFHFTKAPNYLNHPAPYYIAMAWLGPRLEGRPHALFRQRLINIALAAAALLALFLVPPAALTRLEFYAYAIPLLAIPVLVPLAGSVNNDNAAFLGGALCFTALWRLLHEQKGRWFALALAGLLIASWAKLTGLLLTGIFAIVVFAFLASRHRLSALWGVLAALVLVLSVAPYVPFIMQYGSPAPDTPAQHAALAAMSRIVGWTSNARLSPVAYVFYFLGQFLAGWLPPHNLWQTCLLVVPGAAVACAVAGIAIAVRRLATSVQAPSEVIVVACAAAFAITFAVHLWFSYQRHVASGWMMDAYPRYYLPIIAFVPLAGITAARALDNPKWRRGLLAFLTLGPILFRVLAVL